MEVVGVSGAYWYEGLWNVSPGSVVLYTLVMTHVTIVSVTVYLHRHSAHRALELHPALAHFFRFWLWLTTGMSTREWTAIHRKHHATCETSDDPHSPQIHGLAKVLFQGAELYGVEAHTPATMERYGRGTPDDWVERNVYGRYKRYGIAAMAVIDVALFGPLGLTVWAVQMLWIPFLAAGVVNGVGHYAGYRNFETPDASRNLVPWGVLIGGEELHNNHHTYPNSAKLSVRPWEFDLGWVWIRLFAALGLATSIRTGPLVARAPGKDSIDRDTAWALFNDRFALMSRYADRVLGPLVQEQREHGVLGATRGAASRARAVLSRHRSRVSAADRAEIERLTTSSPRLRTAYELADDLMGVWADPDVDQRVNALRAWCARADSAGIDALARFSRELRSYTVPRSHALSTFPLLEEGH